MTRHFSTSLSLVLFSAGSHLTECSADDSAAMSRGIKRSPK
jgi:hypothetical protein